MRAAPGSGQPSKNNDSDPAPVAAAHLRHILRDANPAGMPLKERRPKREATGRSKTSACSPAVNPVLAVAQAPERAKGSGSRHNPRGPKAAAADRTRARAAAGSDSAGLRSSGDAGIPAADDRSSPGAATRQQSAPPAVRRGEQGDAKGFKRNLAPGSASSLGDLRGAGRKQAGIRAPVPVGMSGALIRSAADVPGAGDSCTSLADESACAQIKSSDELEVRLPV